jgi:hypothetical protein
VKRSDRGASGAAGPPVRTRFQVAPRWLLRRKRIGSEPQIGEITVTDIPRPEPVATERPHEREWNIWELERLAREQAGDAARDQEWAALFMHLRQFANADGVLPTQFDGLVRESFSRLIQAA